MASSRFKKDRRDPGRFITVPVGVLECPAYVGLGHSARALLFDVASQYRGDNNGRLLAGWTFMADERGWRGKHTLLRAKEELLATEVLLIETRKGARPNKSSWYACTWWPLDWSIEMDISEQAFPRGSYRRTEVAVASKPTIGNGAKTTLSAGAVPCAVSAP